MVTTQHARVTELPGAMAIGTSLHMTFDGDCSGHADLVAAFDVAR
jgi:hypothetical protein